MKNKIHRVAILGGPCGGKTSFMAYCSQKLSDRGYYVIVVPEAATICINGNLSPVNPFVGVEVGQRAIAGLALHLENEWLAAANVLSLKAEVVVLFDRGIPDGSAYMPTDMYEKILVERGLNSVHVRDQRYDGGVHLVTAAYGAESHYTLENNKARHEQSLETARQQDDKLVHVWIGCEHFRIVDNSTGFEEKLRRAYAEVCGIIGAPPIERERKFLVSFDESRLPLASQAVDIEQFYLVSNDPNVVLRLRKRGQRGFSTYYRTTKQSCGHGENIEIQDFSTAAEYEFGLNFRRPDTAIVQKTRICFPYLNRYYFELDRFKDSRAIPSDGLLELEETAGNLQNEILVPDWIKIEREVTGDPRFSNLAIAKALAKS